MNWEDAKEGHGQRLVVLGDWIKAGEVDKGEILAGSPARLPTGRAMPTRRSHRFVHRTRSAYGMESMGATDASNRRSHRRVAVANRRGRAKTRPREKPKP